MLAARDNVLVDSGYCTHRERTLELLAGPEGLDRQPLERLVNTLEWEAYAAPGHDMDALMFHEPV